VKEEYYAEFGYIICNPFEGGWRKETGHRFCRLNENGFTFFNG
jgi:hypothetical protein